MLKKLFIYLDNKMKGIYILITTLMLSLNLNAQCILDDEIVVAHRLVSRLIILELVSGYGLIWYNHQPQV